MGVQFTVKGVSGHISEASDLDAVLQGSDGQIYNATNCNGCGDITAGTDFANGSINLGPGQSETGWVSFAVPNGVRVAAVKWTPGNGSDGTDTVTWSLAGGQ